MPTHRLPTLLATMTMTLLTAAALHAQTSMGTAFKYQGHLTDSGSPANGLYDLEFTLWDAGIDGVQVAGPVVLSSEPVSNGLFTVSLDFGESIFTGQARWLEVAVNGTALSPRQELTPAPYGLYSDSTRGIHVDDQGRLGIGTDQTWGRLSVWTASTFADMAIIGHNAATSGTNYGVCGLSESTEGRGVYGYASATSGTNYGVYGRSASTDGRGVYGWADASTGDTSGVYGLSYSTSGQGVYGEASASSGSAFGVFGLSASTTGRGVFGRATASTGDTSGVYGLSESTSGWGVYGRASASSGYTYGLYGRSDSTSGRGVYGEASASSGATYGVGGESASTNGMGMYGYASASSGATYGVFGLSASTSGMGMYGYALASSGYTYGVLGRSDSTSGQGVLGLGNATSGSSIGVKGQTNSPDGFAGYFVGGKNYFEGNVGIGTTTPDARLVVSSSSATNNAVFIDQNGPHWGLRVAAEGNDNDPNIPIIRAESPQNTTVMTVNTNGNVGIGTTSPTATLDVVSSGAYHASNSTLTVRDVSNRGTLFLESATDQPTDFVFRNNGLKRWWLSSRDSAFNYNFAIYRGDDSGAPIGTLTIDRTNGNVGIGTGAPAAHLHLDQAGPSGDGFAAFIGPAYNNGTSYNEGNQRLALMAWGGSGGLSLGEHYVGGYLIENDGSDLTFKSGYNGAHGEKVRITSDGNVGIGTPSWVGGPRLLVQGPRDSVQLKVSGRPPGGEIGYPTLEFKGMTINAYTENVIPPDGTMQINNESSGDVVLAMGGGNVGIGTYSPDSKLDVRGTTTTEVLTITGGSDLSERFEVTAPTGKIEPGMVVIIDPNHPGQLKLAKTAYDHKVAGIISGANGLKPGMVMGAKDQEHADGDWPVALTGRVWCWCDTQYGAIEPGDLLTTSATPGHAMRVADHTHAQGAIIGKAMTSLESGEGLVLVLVSLQ